MLPTTVLPRYREAARARMPNDGIASPLLKSADLAPKEEEGRWHLYEVELSIFRLLRTSRSDRVECFTSDSSSAALT
jgi:hypothetical protein